MHKKLILLSLISSSIIPQSFADDIATQLQLANQVKMQNTNNLWQRMRDGFALDHPETKEVLYWEKRYSSPKYFNIIMQNMAPYLYFVVGEMERRGIPLELALIPIVESTYNPNAISPAAVSTGMWQFLAGSGKRFGMTINSDIDERKDIVKSTRGAINYLVYLHDLFGSWELAIAAYNWGEGNINNAVNSANSKNFFELDVRDVTKQYVPKVIALSNIIQNPSKFGIKLIDLPNQPYFAITYPPTPITVSNFMTQSGMDTNLNKKLNPQYSSLSYKVGTTQRLLLPVQNQAMYLASIGTKSDMPITNAAAPIEIVDTVNAIKPVSKTPPENDPIASIATQTSDDGVVVGAASSATTVTNSLNQKQNSSETTNAQQINDLLENSSSGVTTKNNAMSNSYTVQQGDTLYSISKKFATTPASIQSANNMNDANVGIGQQLIIPSQ